MTILTKEIKAKVEKHLKENECANSVIWGEDSCTAFDTEGNPIDDFIIDIEDRHIYCTSVENNEVSLEIA